MATQTGFEVFEHVLKMIVRQDLGEIGVATETAILLWIGLDESAIASPTPLSGYEKNQQG
jgi:hypothetical protein